MYSQEELWKIVDGYPDYLVSSLGKVMSNKGGKSIVLSKRYHNKGYIQYIIRNENGGRSFKAHRMVAEAFIPNAENKPQINHINGIKDDNRVENLEWCTNLENARHSWTNGRKAISGQEHHKTKLSEPDIIFIRNSDLPSRALGRMFGVNKSSILRVRNLQNHKCLA
jgi:hypothetical protein